MKDETRLTRLGRPHDERGQVNPSVARGSTMLAPSAAELYDFPPGRVHYGRVGLETHQALRGALTELQGGAGCALTSSGLMANTLSILASVEAGGTVLAADCIYGPVRNFLLTTMPKFGVKTEFFAPRMGAEIADLITDETQAILLESPGSLTMEMQDMIWLTVVAVALRSTLGTLVRQVGAVLQVVLAWTTALSPAGSPEALHKAVCSLSRLARARRVLQIPASFRDFHGANRNIEVHEDSYAPWACCSCRFEHPSLYVCTVYHCKCCH